MGIAVEPNKGQTVVLDFIGFSGGERHVQLPINMVIEGDVLIRARINSSNDLLDLMLTVNALRHRFGQDLVIDIEMPYLPYARQDRVCSEGQAFSLEVMAQIINGMCVRNFITWDCHSSVGVELTSAINISAVDIIRSNQVLINVLTAEDTVLICPDKGAVNRCKAIKETIGVAAIVQCEKQRNPATGKITHTDVLVDSLEGKTAVVTDDICDGGRTFIEIAKQLKAKNAKKVILYVTHGIFSKGFKVFDGLIDEIYTTNSFVINSERKEIIEVDYQY